MEKEERISREYEKLTKEYKDLPSNKKTLIFPQLKSLAFMRITLDDLEEIIDADNCVELYQNGRDQFGKKESPEIKIYNTLIKNYYTLAEKLAKELPPQKVASKLDALR